MILKRRKNMEEVIENTENVENVESSLIETVENLGNDTYLINGKVKIFNIVSEDSKILYDAEYDDNEMSEAEATELCNELLSKAVQSFRDSQQESEE
jgi:hypothetical protein